jgi:hypothetical protein
MSSYFHIIDNVVVNVIECADEHIEQLDLEGTFVLSEDHPHAWIGSVFDNGVFSPRPEVDPPVEG